jgi:hypothetical protein
MTITNTNRGGEVEINVCFGGTHGMCQGAKFMLWDGCFVHVNNTEDLAHTLNISLY